jgi:hypothetical protein
MTSSVPEATDSINYIEFLVQLSIFHLVNEDCTELELSMSQLELSMSQLELSMSRLALSMSHLDSLRHFL